MLEEILRKMLKPIIQEVYKEGYKDGERRVLKAYEYGWHVGHADTMCALGEIDIEEIDKGGERMSDRITYCDVCECAECPKYGDDCDGDKRVDDLISRSDAIEAVCGVVIDEFDVSPTKGYEVSEKALSALPSAEAEPSLKAIKRQIDEHWYFDPPSAEAVQGWIPCSERLPSESGTYLTTTAKGSVCTDHFYVNSNDICGRHWSYHRRREPIAWMPLPKPYKGGDDK